MVDDDDTVRQAATAWLEVMGQTPIEAADGLAALDLAKVVPPDLALLDFVMPGMNGAEVARRLRERIPGLKVIFVTGYASADELDPILGPDAVVLRKPYSYDDLYLAVADALSESV